MFRRINKEFELVFRVRAFWKHEGKQWMVYVWKMEELLLLANITTITITTTKFNFNKINLVLVRKGLYNI